MIVLGLGTGRCGTTSLTELLKGCDGTYFTHEGAPMLPWKATDEAKERALEWLAGHKGHAPIWGDVSFAWLKYVPSILEARSDVRVIALTRDRGEVAWSFVRHLRTIDATLARFPTYVSAEDVDGWRRYWDEYHKHLRRLQDDYDIPCFDVEALSTREGQKAIFEAAGIPEECRVYQEHCHYNRTK